jgi:predicted transcriptional regulator
MARPKARDLTERELEIMHAFWNHGPQTVAEVRDRLAAEGRDLAYTTVATLVRILCDKACLAQTNAERPFVYRPLRSFEDVSRNFLRDLTELVFRGSREQLLVQLMGQKKLSKREREVLEQILREQSR